MVITYCFSGNYDSKLMNLMHDLFLWLVLKHEQYQILRCPLTLWGSSWVWKAFLSQIVPSTFFLLKRESLLSFKTPSFLKHQCAFSGVIDYNLESSLCHACSKGASGFKYKAGVPGYNMAKWVEHEEWMRKQGVITESTPWQSGGIYRWARSTSFA